MIYNLTKKNRISKKTFYALSFMARGRGMIGRNFNTFDAMVFQRCSCLHTMFMTIPIDVVFVDQSNTVCGTIKGLRPWRPFVKCPGAFSVIELPKGAIEKTNTEKGDVIDLNAELSENTREKIMAKNLIKNTETVIPFSGNRK